MGKLFSILILFVSLAGISSAHIRDGIETECLANTIKEHQPGETQNDTIDPFLVETKSSVRLFRDMDNYSSVILYIPKNEVIEVFEEVDIYYVANYEGNKGYILSAKVKPLNFSQQIEDENTTTTRDSQDRLNYLMNKYDEKTAQAIFSHRLWIGMSTIMARESCGNPIKMDRYMAMEPKFEEWTYSKYLLFFEGGKLAGWELR